VVEEHIDGAGDRCGLAVEAGGKNPRGFGKHEMRNPCSVGNEVLRQRDLLRVVAGDEAHEDVGVNGVHAWP
jgi:hypothetical protein